MNVKIRFGAIRFGRDSGGAEAGLAEHAERAALEIEHFDHVARVLKIRDGDHTLAERHGFDDGILSLGHEVAPLRAVRVGRRHGDDTSFGCALGRLQVQDAVDHRAGRLSRFAGRDHAPIELAGLPELVEVGQPEVVRLCVHPIAEHQPAPVARQARKRPPGRRERLVFVPGELPEEHRVSRAVGPEPVKQHLAAVRIVRILEVLIDEPGSVGQPIGCLGLVRDLERQRPAGVDFQQMKRRVLVAGAVRPVRQEPAVRLMARSTSRS